MIGMISGSADSTSGGGGCPRSADSTSGGRVLILRFMQLVN